jgi:hypothetical protein
MTIDMGAAWLLGSKPAARKRFLGLPQDAAPPATVTTS